MKLKTWIEENGLGVEQFAELIQCKPVTVYRYSNGKRTPVREVMKRIFEVTDGKVTPNDFFDLDLSA